MAMYDNNPEAMRLFDRADEILGFGLSKIIFDGTEEELKLSLIHISEPTRLRQLSRMPSSA